MSQNDHSATSAEAQALNVLSVDPEDYFQVKAFADVISRDAWPRFELRLVRDTCLLLDVLVRHGDSVPSSRPLEHRLQSRAEPDITA